MWVNNLKHTKHNPPIVDTIIYQTKKGLLALMLVWSNSLYCWRPSPRFNTGIFWIRAWVVSHSARVVHSTSFSDVTSRGWPNLGPFVSFPDVLLRPGVRRTLFQRATRTWRRCNVLSTSAKNKDVRKTYIRAQIRSSSWRPCTSFRVGCQKLFVFA